MALHTGVAEVQDGDYFGQPLNRVARLLSSGHGGQTLMSAVTHDLVRDMLPERVSLLDLGEHRLKDLLRPEHIFQLVVAGLDADFPPLKTLDYRTNNLPFERSLLIGREKELAEIEKLLLRHDVDLLTITGPGGTGKTRLALQAAADVLDSFGDGVFFANLAPIVDPALVVPNLIQVLGLREAAGQSSIELLKGYLREKEMLLVLDNFEQVAGAAREVGQLLAAAPRVKVLATSRVPLRIKGEKEYPAPPLSLPDTGQLPPLERLTQYDSVRLFIERATDVKPDFQVTNENAPAVAEICVRLDGLPLAIELAAARVRLFPPQALLGRLSSRLKLLTGGARDLPARQQTLRGAIEWSYDLLDDGEKQFFRRIAVFQGGRTIEALEGVCNFDGQLQMDMLDGVESLVSKSLLRQGDGVEETGGEPRFWMLETIQEYAREELEHSGEAGALSREHALYFMGVVEEAEPYLRGAGQAEWLARLEAENDNIRAAFSWALADVDAEVALRLGGALRWFWELRGHLSEGRRLLRQALARGSEVALPVRAKALYAAGGLAWRQLDLEVSSDLLEQSKAAYEALGDKVGIGLCLNDLGVVAMCHFNFALGRSLLEQSLVLFEQAGDRKNAIFPLTNLADCTRQEGDYDSARRQFEEVLPRAREFEWEDYVALHLVTLGHILHEQGDYAGAVERVTEGMSVARKLGYKQVIALCLADLAGVASSLRQGERAARLFGAAITIHQEKVGVSITSTEHGTEYKRDIAKARAQLGDEAFDKATHRGSAMSMDEAIEYALEKT
jgi:predicted ATPase